MAIMEDLRAYQPSYGGETAYSQPRTVTAAPPAAPQGIVTEPAGSKTQALRQKGMDLFGKAKAYGTQAISEAAASAERAAGKAGLTSPKPPPVAAGYVRDASGMITRAGAATAGRSLLGMGLRTAFGLPGLAIGGAYAVANYLDQEGQAKLELAHSAHNTGRTVPRARPSPVPGDGSAQAPVAQAPAPQPPSILRYARGTPQADDIGNAIDGGVLPPERGGYMHTSEGNAVVFQPRAQEQRVLRAAQPAPGPRHALDGVDPNNMVGFRGAYLGVPQVANNISQIRAQRADQKFSLDAAKQIEDSRSNRSNEELKAYDIDSRNASTLSRLQLDANKQRADRAQTNSEYIRKLSFENAGITDVSKASQQVVADARQAERRTVATLASLVGEKNFTLGDVPPESLPDVMALVTASQQKDADREGIAYTLKRMLLNYRKPSKSDVATDYVPSSLRRRGFAPDVVDSLTGTETAGSYMGDGSYFGTPDVEKARRVDVLRRRGY